MKRNCSILHRQQEIRRSKRGSVPRIVPSSGLGLGHSHMANTSRPAVTHAIAQQPWTYG